MTSLLFDYLLGHSLLWNCCYARMLRTHLLCCTTTLAASLPLCEQVAPDPCRQRSQSSRRRRQLGRRRWGSKGSGVSRGQWRGSICVTLSNRLPLLLPAQKTKPGSAQKQATRRSPRGLPPSSGAEPGSHLSPQPQGLSSSPPGAVGPAGLTPVATATAPKSTRPARSAAKGVTFAPAAFQSEPSPAPSEAVTDSLLPGRPSCTPLPWGAWLCLHVHPHDGGGGAHVTFAH